MKINIGEIEVNYELIEDEKNIRKLRKAKNLTKKLSINMIINSVFTMAKP